MPRPQVHATARPAAQLAAALLLALTPTTALAQSRSAPSTTTQPTGPRQPTAVTPSGRLERVVQGEADLGELSTTLRRLQPDLRAPERFEQVYRIPGRPGAPDRMARVSGAVTAVFPESEYALTKRGTRADIPAGTIFFLGKVRDVTASPFAFTPSTDELAARARTDRVQRASLPVLGFTTRVDTRAPAPTVPTAPPSPDASTPTGTHTTIDRSAFTNDAGPMLSSRVQQQLGILPPDIRARLNLAPLPSAETSSITPPNQSATDARPSTPPQPPRPSRVRDLLLEAVAPSDQPPTAPAANR